MDNERAIIIGNANLFTLGENNRNLKDGAIYAEDGIIKRIDRTPVLQKEYPDARFIDMRGMVTLPGNVIAHTHLYSSLARGMSLKDDDPGNFCQILERLWWRLDKALTPEDIYYSALVYLVQCIKYGTTTILDHHASASFIETSLDIIERAVLESGIRACLCYEVTDRGGEDRAKAGIDENIRFINKCRKERTDYIRASMGFHASFTVSDKTWKQALNAMEKVDGKPAVHIHVEEDMADRRDSEEKYGVPVLERLDKLGVTKYPILACHCTHIADSEYEILKKNDIYVIHNPSSNMNNAVGIAPVTDIMDAGVPVGLGTDGMTADFFSEMKMVPLAQKARVGDPRAIGFDKIYEMIFINNPKIASLFWKEHGVGTIEVGNYADVIGLDYVPPTPLTAENLLGHILFGVTAQMVDTVVVNGQELMEKRSLIHLDEERIMARARELAKDLWERF